MRERRGARGARRESESVYAVRRRYCRNGSEVQSHITEAVGGNQSAVSHQLKILKDNKIIKSRRNGKNVLYSVSDWHVLTMINVAKEHLNCNE